MVIIYVGCMNIKFVNRKVSIGSGTKTTHQRIFLELMLTNHDAFSRHSSRILVTMSQSLLVRKMFWYLPALNYSGIIDNFLGEERNLWTFKAINVSYIG